MLDNESGISLLNLTPVCLQNTNNIINTLIFMCLDQGHDFRDTSKRTNVSGGKKGWVNAEYNKDSYLKKIKNNELITLYQNANQTNGEVFSNDLFGKNEFMKGLLNTTFTGNPGAFGLILIEDEDFKMFGSNADKMGKTIEKKLIEIVSFQLNQEGSNYYIQFKTGTNENYGTKFSLQDQSDPSGGQHIEATLLPFYKRCYNDGMHKLWSFNTKKHIYLLNLEKLKLEMVENVFSLITTENSFKCEYFTEIDLIVPQYYFNFNSFHSRPKKSIKSSFEKEYESVSSESVLNKNLDFETMEGFDEKIAFDIFAKSLFNGKFTQDMNKDSDEQTNSSSQDTFTFPESNIIAYESIPRGVKYWFANCQKKAFNYFLKLLYKYQSPFIHPLYIIKNDIDNKITTAKSAIFAKLTEKNNELLHYYRENKNNLTSNKVDNEHFILKQYGVITDTSIGNNKSKSTIDFLIDSLNNTQPGTSCDSQNELDKYTLMTTTDKTTMPTESSSYESTGGAEGDLSFLNKYNDIQDAITEIETTDNFSGAKRYIKEIYEFLTNMPEEQKQDLINKFTSKIKELYRENSLDVDKLSSKYVSISSTLTTEEKPSEFAPTDKSVKDIFPQIEISEEQGIETFDNIENVNNIFNLALTPPLGEYVKVNSNTGENNKKFQEYIDEFSNDLQQYYDFRPQTGFSEENNYFNICWKSIDFYDKVKISDDQTAGAKKYSKKESMSTYPYKFTISSGQLDSSGLGGQSIPIYHPPEIDVYMTIFNTSGQLEGIIVRMVIIKEVLENPINTKSKVAVFCHFVYVDYDKAKLDKPSSPSDYSGSIAQLLKYAVDNTKYVGTESCIDINNLSKDMNEKVDFILYFPPADNNDNNQPEKVQSRNWYKYFTTTTGPSVEKGIVSVVQGQNVIDLQSARTAGETSKGIVNAAYYIIKNSKSLKKIFGVPQMPYGLSSQGKEYELTDDDLNIHPGIALFIKLFLVRNKYTGDKSRATDSLFLNQTKYLEGIQASNDENTLYNAVMFGQNTIWSTSSKSVFNMAPYYTKTNKMSISSGFYTGDLCNGLKNNPLFKSDTGEIKESKTEGDQKAIEIQETRNELLESWYLLNPGSEKKILSCVDESIGPSKLAHELVTGIFDMDEFLEKYEEYNFFINNDQNLADINDINDYLKNLNKKTAEILNLLTSLKNKTMIILETFRRLIGVIYKCDIQRPFAFSIIYYMGKNFPWWVYTDIKNYINKISNEHCKKFNEIAPKVKDIIDATDNTRQKNAFYTTFASKIKESPNLDNPYASCLPVLNLKSSSKSDVKYPIDVNLSANPLPTFTKTLTEEHIDNDEDDDDAKKKERAKNTILTNAKIIDVSNKFYNLLIDYLDKYPVSNKDKFDFNKIEFDKIVNEAIGYANDLATQSFPDEVSSDNYVAEMERISENFGHGLTKPSGQGTTEIVGGGSDEMLKESIVRLSDFRINKPVQQIYETPSKITPVSKVKSSTSVNFQENTIDETSLKQFYIDSCKCNNGNYLKSFIPIIKQIENQYQDLNINYENDTVYEVFVKFLLIKINMINNSFMPAIKNADIIQTIENVNTDYSFEQINTILNRYNTQFNLFSVIDSIINYNIVNENGQLLVDLINDNTSDYEYSELKLGFNKVDLINRVLMTEGNENQNHLTIDNNVSSSPIKQKIMMAGSIKNKRKQHNKTRNSKRKNKRNTVKKNKLKVRRYTIKNKF